MKIRNVCQDCGVRKLGCHATCERYLEAKKEQEEAKAKMYAENEHNAYLREVHAKVERRMRNRR